MRSDSEGSHQRPCANSLVCVTWNVAAVNNNPFEYWVTHDDAAYLKLMNDVQNFINSPASDQDVEVGAAFPNELFEELAAAMDAEGWAGVEETRQLWQSDFSRRSIISGFLKDRQIGAKRLASMPDRITNTISLASGACACRPSVMSNYSAKLPDIPTWWAAWKAFMFEEELEIPAKGGGTKKVRPCAMLSPIQRSKYPSLTEKEEELSLPLQALCCAILDAILVHMLNAIAPETWHGVKSTLCSTLSTNKVPLTRKILEEYYADTDVIFLQECAAGFVDALTASPIINDAFHVLVPEALDTKRDQNSLILASRRVFDGTAVEEVTADVTARAVAAGGPKIESGDLYAAIVQPASDGSTSQRGPWLLASFHGDTDGLATVPVLNAIHAAREARSMPKPQLLFGLDANTYCKGDSGKKLGAAEFSEACIARGLGECWGGHAAEAPLECCTTFNARTFLQPQLNKAVSRTAAATSQHTDRNPKDYIVFDPNQFAVYGEPERDNQGGRGAFDAEAPFPTLHFPSDHAILLVTLSPVVNTAL